MSFQIKCLQIEIRKKQDYKTSPKRLRHGQNKVKKCISKPAKSIPNLDQKLIEIVHPTPPEGYSWLFQSKLFNEKIESLLCLCIHQPCSFIGCLSDYSGVPITRAGSNKRAGWNFHKFSPNEQVLIRASRVEKCIFFFNEMIASRVEFLET